MAPTLAPAPQHKHPWPSVGKPETKHLQIFPLMVQKLLPLAHCVPYNQHSVTRFTAKGACRRSGLIIAGHSTLKSCPGTSLSLIIDL